MRTVGDWTLLHPLGEGGMAQVWAARHREAGESAAIKSLLPALAVNATARARFAHEVRALAILDHPCLVPVLDRGTLTARESDGEGLGPEGTPWFAMPWFRGGALVEVPGWSAVAAVGERVLRGLAHTHAAGFVHRDVKPQNVLLPRPGAYGEVRLGDFGLARDGEDRGGVGGGTPAYMAPEQASGDWRRLDARTDLYAFGQLIWALCHREPRAAGSRFAPGFGVPARLPDLLERLLAERPDERPGSAAAVLEAWRALGAPRPRTRSPRPNPRTRGADLPAGVPPMSPPTPTLLPAVQPTWIPEDAWGPASTPLAPEEAPAEPGHARPSARSEGASSSDTRIRPRLSGDSRSAGRAPPEPPRVEGAGPRAGSSPAPPARPQVDAGDARLRSFAAVREVAPSSGARGLLPELPKDWREPESAPPPSPAPSLLGLRRPPFTGRLDERDVLWSELRASAEGLRVVAIVGEPGMGASRLAGWLAARAAETGAVTVLEGRHTGAADDGLAGAVARWTRVDGLVGDRALSWIASHSSVAVPPGDAPALTEVLAPADPPRVRFRDDAERRRPLVRLVERLAAKMPVLLVLDDAHLGPGTAPLLDALRSATTPSGRALPLLIVLTGPLDLPALGARVVRLAAMPSATMRIYLESGLGLAPTDAAALEERVGGNPGLALATVAAAWSAGRLVATRVGAAFVGEVSLAGTWPDRIRSLAGTPLGDALELAAVLGEPVEAVVWRSTFAAGVRAPRAAAPAPPTFRHSPGLPTASPRTFDPGHLPVAGAASGGPGTPGAGGQSFEALVETAVTQGLLHAHPRDPDLGWTFPSGLREALESQAERAGRAPRWHRAAADTLDRLRVRSPARFARHLLGAGEPESAIPWIRRAAIAEIDAGDRRVADARVRMLDEALDAAGVPAVSAPRADAAWLHARVRRLLGDSTGALEASERGRVIARLVGAVREEVRCASERAEALRMLGRTVEAREVLEAVEVAARASGDPGLLGVWEQRLGTIAFQQQDAEAAIRAGERARVAFLADRDPVSAATAMNLVGCGHGTAGRFAEAREAFAVALAEQEAVGCRWGAADAANNLGYALYQLGDLAGATVYLERSAELWDQVGSPLWVSPRLNLARVRLDERDYAGAEIDAEAALVAVRRFGLTPALQAEALATLFAARACLGDPGAADLRAELLTCMADLGAVDPAVTALLARGDARR